MHDAPNPLRPRSRRRRFPLGRGLSRLSCDPRDLAARGSIRPRNLAQTVTPSTGSMAGRSMARKALAAKKAVGRMNHRFRQTNLSSWQSEPHGGR
jgi:hypothetical protein